MKTIEQLSAKQGEQGAVCPLCHGKGEHEMFSAHLPGQPVPERRMVKCNQCANPAPSVNAQERISELEAQNAQLLESLRHMVTFFERFEDTHTVLAMDEARATIAAVEGKYDR